ncbi:carbohydrate esterase family 3 protein [Nemania abortiva]|nr:carbohydrate esterase family 3 protein [Nemania abortiva]
MNTIYKHDQMACFWDQAASENNWRLLANLTIQRVESFYLRVMPLGASITYGDPAEAASLGRGYRKYIRDYLRWQGWQVNMVGSRNYGQFADNDVEGWPGFIIDNVTEKARAAVPKYKPNLILLNVGTNDATRNIDVENAGERIKVLVRECFDLSPGVVVVLSTLLPNKNAPENVKTINGLYRNVVIDLLDEGLKIQLADMDDGFITPDLLISDGTHPTIEGQRRMAAVWAQAIHEVDQKGDWLQEPSSDVGFSDKGGGSTCEKVYNSGAQDPRNGMQVLRGTSGEIKDDGNYIHRSEPRGEVWRQNIYKHSGNGPPGVYSAQVVNLGGADRGGERDDIILVNENVNSQVNIYLNRGDGVFEFVSGSAVEGNCINRGKSSFTFLPPATCRNNDGLDDFICIDPSGNMFVSINKGENPPYFKDIGKFKDAAPGYSQKNVRLGDIDGDGRLDYCVINDNGSLQCWRNGGILPDAAAYWQDLGIVFTPPQPIGDIETMRFVDINGDFRSDILWVDEIGRVRTWINQRGRDKSLVPYWRDAGVTHLGMGENVGGQQNIIFGRIYSGRPSYLYLHNKDAASFYEASIDAWENLGSGGTHQKGDGAHWGDMTGTGNDDYVWIDPDGAVVIFPNVNTPPDTSKYPNWGVAQVALRTGLDRKALHLGDWNNDGKADIIGVDKKTGAITIWLTSYSNGVFSFNRMTSDISYCSEGWGVGLFDIGAHFADITGSGCVDYLCMKPDGHTTAWLNDCKQGLFNLRNVGQVKFTERLDRANHRFADVNGDGLADFLWVDKFTGDASVWINDGEKPEDQRPALLGSKFKWIKSGPLYAGSSRGPNLHYPNLGGIGRADQVEVDPNTAQGWISFNTCPAGGDDGGIVPRDPSLPGYIALPVCPVSTCRIDLDGWCGPDPFADDFADDDQCDFEDGEPALREVIGVFRYINHPDVLPIIRQNIMNMQRAADAIAASDRRLAVAGSMFREFYPAWYQEAARTARAWLSDRLVDIIATYTQAIRSGNAPPNAAIVQAMINALFDDLVYVVSPF